MTLEDFKTADNILKRINIIDNFIEILLRTPFIGAERSGEIGLSNGIDKIYLSLVDTENKELRNIILNWCKNEKEKLSKMLEKL